MSAAWAWAFVLIPFLLAASGAIAIGLGRLAQVLRDGGHAELATRAEHLERKLEVAHEALEVAFGVMHRHEEGQSFFQAVLEEGKSDAAHDLVTNLILAPRDEDGKRLPGGSHGL